MKKNNIYIIAILLILVTSTLQAQQSEFQGIWKGDTRPRDVSAYRIEITENRWQQFLNNEIEGSGTIRFFPGKAELLLADGRLAWDLRLLAPGLIEQPPGWVAVFRFRHVDVEELRRQADEHFRNRHYEQAEALYTELIKYFPNDSVLYNNRGFSIWWEGISNRNDQNRAIADFTQAIRLNPNFAEAYFNRGRAHSTLRGETNKAITDFTRAIQLNPNYFDPYHHRGFIYHITFRDFNRAISDYEAALRINPNDYATNHLLERARQGLAEHELW